MKQIIDGLSYPIILSDDAAGEVVASLAPNASGVALIYDSAVHERAAALRAALERNGARVQAELPLGMNERKKNQRTATALYDALLSAGADRRTVIVAVGGGTLTDVAGFVAATYLRGVDWIAVPTTLLGMVDAAIGGKTGIDLPQGKNMVGAFWEPAAVVADISALATLPLKQRRSGLAEVVKAGVIGDPMLLETLRRHSLRATPQAWLPLIAAAARVKVTCVASDMRDCGVRAALNLGHTAGHAIEAVSRYRMPHGYALSIGLRVAGILARDRTGWPLADHSTMVRRLQRLRLPLSLPPFPIEELVEAMRVDKKRAHDALRFVLPLHIGAVQSGIAVPLDEVRAALRGVQQPPAEGGW
ncbi:MAG: 3-dehydroquinate synthase [Candidatus Eremiobacteraeota bacterium]|nr:3-dehydroquinate synthase [Candidatus Eremiobacteraeota bacterium]